MAPIPALPIHLIDGILALAARPLAPHSRPASVQLVQILQVLPPSLLRSTFCSVVHTANAVIGGPSTLSNERPNLTFEPLVLSNLSDPGLLELFNDILVPMLKWEKRICTAFVYQLCSVGHLDLLERLRQILAKNRQPGSVAFGDLVNGLAGALPGGHVDVLKWWHAHDPLPMALFTPMACSSASETGRVQLLEWCYEADVDFEEHLNLWEIEQCVFDALGAEHVHVLDWWLRLAKAGSLFDELPLPAGIWTHLCKKGKLDSLKWLTDNSIPIDQLNTPSHDCIDLASEHGHTDILQWWLTSRTDFDYTPDAMDKASANGHLDTLNWWKCSGETLSFTPRGRQGALANLHLDIVGWWDQLPLFSFLSGASDTLPVDIDSLQAMNRQQIVSFGRLDLLQKSDVDHLLWDLESLFMVACRHGHLHILEAYKERIQAQIDHDWIWVLHGISNTGAMQWCLHNIPSVFAKLDADGSTSFWNHQLQHAAEKGSIELVDWIFTHILKSAAVPLTVVAAACAHHRVNVLELLLQRHGLRETVDAWTAGNQTDTHPLMGMVAGGCDAEDSVLEWWERNGLPAL